MFFYHTAQNLLLAKPVKYECSYCGGDGGALINPANKFANLSPRLCIFEKLLRNYNAPSNSFKVVIVNMYFLVNYLLFCPEGVS